MTITVPEISNLARGNESRGALIASWRHGLELAMALVLESHATDSEKQLLVNALMSGLPDEQRVSLLVGMTAAADANEESVLFDVAKLASSAMTATLRDAFGGGAR